MISEEMDPDSVLTSRSKIRIIKIKYYYYGTVFGNFFSFCSGPATKRGEGGVKAVLLRKENFLSPYFVLKKVPIATKLEERG